MIAVLLVFMFLMDIVSRGSMAADSDINKFSGIKGIITSTEQKSIQKNKRFQITLMNMGDDQTYDSSFMRAKKRWEKVILNDLPDIPAQQGTGHDWFDGVFGHDKAVNVSIDDILIGYEVTEIDGIPTKSNNILGQAIPTYVRLMSKLSAPTISGIMIFDKADFDSMNMRNVDLIIAHEMGHILGIGRHTLSWFCGSLCRVASFASYQCPRAKNEYRVYRDKYILSSTSDISMRNKTLELSLPDCGHWDEKNFQSLSSSELMTPVFEKGMYQPLSRVSVAALEDIGYSVNYNGADPWKQSNSNQRFIRWNASSVSSDWTHGSDESPMYYYYPTESFTLHHKSWLNNFNTKHVFLNGSDVIIRIDM